MLIPEDMQWDSFDEDEQPRLTKVSPYDRIRLWFEEEVNSTWAQLLNPAVDAYVATQQIVNALREQGQEMEDWPEDYDSAPLLRRASRIQRKQNP